MAKRGYRVLVGKSCWSEEGWGKIWIYARNLDSAYYGKSTDPPLEFKTRKEALDYIYSTNCRLHKPILESPGGMRERI